MIVTVGEQVLVVPLSHIVESLRPGAGMIKRLGPTGSLIDVRGTYVPILTVANSLGIPQHEPDPERGVLIVVESDQGQAALLVDSIQDQRQVVVKSLDANYQPIAGVAGATILGNGRVALIIDVDALASRERLAARSSRAAAA